MVERRIAFLAERKHADVDSLLRMAADSAMFCEARTAAHSLIASTEGFLLAKALRDLALVGGLSGAEDLPSAWQPEETQDDDRARSIVPKRVYRGPYRASTRETPPEFEEKVKAFRAKHVQDNVAARHLEYWSDGKRTLSEIADLIEGETGFRDMGMLVDFFDLQVALGVFSA
jgi:hypothetical protein